MHSHEQSSGGWALQGGPDMLPLLGVPVWPLARFKPVLYPRADDLVSGLQRGDRHAVGLAYDAHHAAVRAFARRLIGDDAAAEDLVHETFITLPSAIRGFRGDSGLRTFIISIAANHARHYVRASMRRRAAMAKLAERPEPDGTGTPEAEMGRAELADILMRALDELPIDQRTAFVLCEVEERTSQEASQITGAPEATIRTRLFHAKKKLREVMQREGVR